MEVFSRKKTDMLRSYLSKKCPLNFIRNIYNPSQKDSEKKEVTNIAFTSSRFVKINVEKDRDIKLAKGQDRPRLFYNSR